MNLQVDVFPHIKQDVASSKYPSLFDVKYHPTVNYR